MANRNLLLEICVDRLDSIKNAINGGADRLELCSALSEGGLTPSIGLVKLAKKIAKIPVFAMIRIRGGDFIYDTDEIDAMVEDIKIFKTLGINGFVFGALTSTNEIDVTSCRKIIEISKPLPVTFHRAFDDVSDPLKAFDQIIDLGFTRLLTSGQKSTALEGIELIEKLIRKSDDNGIIVMPGSGINQVNISIIKDKSTAREFHGSAKTNKYDDEVKTKVGSNWGVTVTDVEIVRQMKKILNKTL